MDGSQRDKDERVAAQARLEAALRENLRRRKAQSQARETGRSAAPKREDEPT